MALAVEALGQVADPMKEHTVFELSIMQQAILHQINSFTGGAHPLEERPM
jgi:hypothetical protein